MPPPNPPFDPGSDPSAIDINFTLLGDPEALNTLVQQLKAISNHMQTFSEQTVEAQTARGIENVRIRRTAPQRGRVEGGGVAASSMGSVSGQQQRGTQPHHGTSPSGSVGSADGPGRLWTKSPFEMSDAEFAAWDAAGRPDWKGGPEPGWDAPEPDSRSRPSRPTPPRMPQTPPSTWRGRLRDAWSEVRTSDTVAGLPRVGGGIRGRVGRGLDTFLPSTAGDFNQWTGAGHTEEETAYSSTTGGGVGGGGGGRGGRGGAGPPYDSGSVGSSGPSGGGGDGGGSGDEDPALRHAVTGGVTLPRYGNLTMQDYLHMGSGWWANRYQNRVDTEGTAADTGGRQAFRAGIANSLGYAAQNWAQVHAVGQFLQNHVLGGNYDPRDMQAQGQAVGGEKGLAIGPFGTPTGSAASLGLQANLERERLRMRPNINKQEADQIVTGLMEQGWSGGTLNRMANTVAAPLTQQGQNPSDYLPLLDQSVRLGQGNLQTFVQTMSHLGDTARQTNMSMSQLTQSMGAYATAAQQHGTSFQQGLQGGREFAATTGMSPEIGANLMNNPMVQGLAMQQGILPSQMGLVGGTGMAQMGMQAAQIAQQLTPGFNKNVNRPIYDAHGNFIGNRTISGNDMQAAAASQISGLPLEVQKDFTDPKRRQRMQATGSGLEALDQWSHGVHPGMSAQQQQQAMAGDAATNNISWHSIATLAQQAGVGQKRIQQITHEDITKRVGDMKQEINKHGINLGNMDQGPTMQVQFTGLAQKLFKGIINDTNGNLKKQLNAGQASGASNAADPTSTSPDITSMLGPNMPGGGMGSTGGVG